MKSLIYLPSLLLCFQLSGTRSTSDNTTVGRAAVLELLGGLDRTPGRAADPVRGTRVGCMVGFVWSSLIAGTSTLPAINQSISHEQVLENPGKLRFPCIPD